MKKLLVTLCTVIFAVAMTVSMVACTPLTHKVTFVNHDGSEILVLDVAHNDYVAYTGEIPQRDPDAQYTYHFEGWLDEAGNLLTEFPHVPKDLVFTASYSTTINEYTVEFVHEGEVIQSEVLPYGCAVVYEGEEPTKAATDDYTYYFNGWNDGTTDYVLGQDLPTVTGAVTYTSIFRSTNNYEVTWNVLGETSSEILEEGTVPEYKGSVPTKEADAQYTYTFAGWALSEGGEVVEISAINADVTYHAVFSATVNNYKVTFCDENGVSIYEADFAYGSIPVFAGELPKLENNAQYSYEYVGWVVDGVTYSFAEDLPAVTGEASYKLALQVTTNKYDVTFVIGEEKSYQKLEYGATPSFEGTPEKEATAEFTYTFAGWSLTDGGEVVELAQVTGDATYYATFTATRNSYEVTFLNEEGQVLQSSSVLYGEVPVMENVPQKDADVQYTYYPAWANGENVYDLRTDVLPAVTGAVVYELTYIAEINYYTLTISYEVESGVVETPAAKSISLAYGTNYGKAETASPAVAGFAPNRYWFVGIITGDVHYSVEYTATTVWDGSTATAFESGSGTESDPYIIKTGAQLAYLAKLGMDNTSKKNDVYGAGVYYKLGSSIDLSAHNWTPIAMRDSAASFDWTYFGGVFDGAGYTVIMEINQASTFGYGFFQALSGTIKNITFAGGINTGHRAGVIAYISSSGAVVDNVYNYADIITTKTDGYVGGLLGSATKTTVQNSYNYGEVKGGQYTAGIIGQSSGSKAINCHNFAEITGASGSAYIGGVVGTSTNSTQIIGATNYCTVNATGVNCGGITGYLGAGSKVEGCINYGDVISTSEDVGGIIGENQSNPGTKNAPNYNFGNVSGSVRVGGIVGRQVKNSIKYSYNYGNVSGTTRIGGIQGDGYGASVVEYCENYGTVTGTGQYIGGIGGQFASMTGNHLINYGDVIGTGANNIAGVVGFATNGTKLTLCENHGDVIGGSTIGGIAGYLGGAATIETASRVAGCVNYGNVSGTGTTGGIVGLNNGYVTKYVSGETEYLTINNGNVSANNYTGGICGNTGVSKDCVPSLTEYAINNGKVTGKDAVGGINGQAAEGGTISNCENNGEVVASGDKVGGIAGYCGGNASVKYSTNNAKVNADGECVGGIVGQSKGTVSNNINKGEVYAGGEYVGGIVGENTGTVSNSENFANITGYISYIGGCIGRNNGGEGHYLTNHGTILAERYQSKAGTGIGGVIGSNQNSATASNLANDGDVYGYTQVGGISGYQGAGSSIDVATNEGNVYGYGTVGQIVGTNNSTELTTNVSGTGEVTDYNP